MNNRIFADVGFAAVALIFGGMAYKNIFVHKSQADYNCKWSLT